MIVNRFPFPIFSPVPTGHIFGVSWDGTSRTDWTRTDDAALFADPVPYVSGASSYGSPFDTLSPWKDMVIVEDADAGTMVKIPKFWYKLTQNGAGMQIQIADYAADGYSVCPACMDRGDGNGERNYILVGRYHCATSTYKSTSGVKPQASLTRANFRNAINNLGTGIYMLDFATRFTIWLLYLVEFADWNSQNKIGYGCGTGNSTSNMGYTDSMPYHTGTTLSSRTTYGYGTQYRYIEGLWDNIFDWIDGCYYNNNGMYIIMNPANFSDNSGGVLIGKPKIGYPGGFSVVSVNGTFPAFVPSASGGTASTYLCDQWNYSSSPNIAVGGYYDNNLAYGLFYIKNYNSAFNISYIGSRAMKLP